jgi:glyceraldehyde-3-phosphate dehydrogenase (NADP+)
MNVTNKPGAVRCNETQPLLSDLFPSPREIPEEFRLDAAGHEPCCLVNGEVSPWDGALAPVTSPICLKKDGTAERPTIGHVPAMDERAALAALDAATRAWNNGRGQWPSMQPGARIEAVESFTASIAEAREEIARLLMWEIGKSLEESRAEIDRTVEYIASTIEALKKARRIEGTVLPVAGVMARIHAAPLGVCLLMGPFNNPIYETYTMLVPALLMGNTAVVKAPRFGVLPHQLLFRSLAEHFPPGVVNFVYGGDAGTDNAGSIMRTGQIDAFSFIGSPAGASALMSQHPLPLRLRSILSLGAKNPALITEDADLETAVRECLLGSLAFNGQRCTALKILFVHESVAGEFLSGFCDAVETLSIGMPWTSGVKITPLPESGKADRMAAYVEDAVKKGGSVVNAAGGDRFGTLFRPAVVYPVSPSAVLYREEQFGPVVPVCRYRSEEEFMEFVASSDYGQQVSIFSRDARQIEKLTGQLENLAGRINVNCKCQRGPDILPFAGRRDSGMTMLSVEGTLRAFSMPSVLAARKGDEQVLNRIR